MFFVDESKYNIFLDLLAESTVLPAAFHSRKNDFCGLFCFFLAH